MSKNLPRAADAALTTAEIARRLSVSTDKIRAWIASGELRAVNLATRRGGRPRYRVLAEDLAAFLAARAVAMPTARSTPRRVHRDKTITEFF